MGEGGGCGGGGGVRSGPFHVLSITSSRLYDSCIGDGEESSGWFGRYALFFVLSRKEKKFNMYAFAVTQYILLLWSLQIDGIRAEKSYKSQVHVTE